MAEQASGIEKKVTGKRVTGKRVRIALASLAVAVGITEIGGAVITELTDNRPVSITRTVPDDLKWPVTLIENTVNRKVPETFINESGKTSFGENNVSKITPQMAEENNLLEPGITVDNTDTVTVTTLLPGIFPSIIPDTQIESEKRDENKDYVALNRKRFIMPEGFRLTIPKGAHYALFEANKGTYQNPNLVYTIVSFYYDTVNKITVSFTYETTGFVPEVGQKIYSRENYNQLYNPSMGGKFEDLSISDGFTPIARPSSPNQVLDVFLNANSGKLEHFSSFSEALSRYMNTTWENHVDANQKLILTSSK